MGNYTKLAIFPGGLDSILIDDLSSNIDIFYLVENNSPDDKWVSQFIDKQKVLRYRITNTKIDPSLSRYENILKYSNIDKVLREKNVKFLLITSRFTKFINEWSIKNKIILVGTKYEDQVNYENKIWFNNLMEENNITHPQSELFTYPNKISLLNEGKIVLQESISRGGEGTFYIEKYSQIDELIKLGKIRKNEQYLVRKFIPGEAYGLDVLIVPNKIILSAVRKQCYYPTRINERLIFSGNQWVATSELPQKAVRNINNVFTKLAILLHKRKYFGYANFDFILFENNVFVLECNARFSGGSPAIVKYHELTSNINTGKLIIEEFVEDKNYAKTPEISGLPDNKFTGSLFYIDIFPELVNKQITIRHEHPSGIYKFVDNTIIFLDPDIRKIDNIDKKFIFYLSSKANDTFNSIGEYATIYSNFPLYNNDKTFSKFISLIQNYFQYE